MPIGHRRLYIAFGDVIFPYKLTQIQQTDAQGWIYFNGIKIFYCDSRVMPILFNIS